MGIFIIHSNNDNIVLESYTNESVLDDEIPERSITCWGDSSFFYVVLG